MPRRQRRRDGDRPRMVGHVSVAEVLGGRGFRPILDRPLIAEYVVGSWPMGTHPLRISTARRFWKQRNGNSRVQSSLHSLSSPPLPTPRHPISLPVVSSPPPSSSSTALAGCRTLRRRCSTAVPTAPSSRSWVPSVPGGGKMPDHDDKAKPDEVRKKSPWTSTAAATPSRDGSARSLVRGVPGAGGGRERDQDDKPKADEARKTSPGTSTAAATTASRGGSARSLVRGVPGAGGGRKRDRDDKPKADEARKTLPGTSTAAAAATPSRGGSARSLVRGVPGAGGGRKRDQDDMPKVDRARKTLPGTSTAAAAAVSEAPAQANGETPGAHSSSQPHRPEKRKVAVQVEAGRRDGAEKTLRLVDALIAIGPPPTFLSGVLPHTETLLASFPSKLPQKGLRHDPAPRQPGDSTGQRDGAAAVQPSQPQLQGIPPDALIPAAVDQGPAVVNHQQPAPNTCPCCHVGRGAVAAHHLCRCTRCPDNSAMAPQCPFCALAEVPVLEPLKNGVCPCCRSRPGIPSADHLCRCSVCRCVPDAVCPHCDLALVPRPRTRPDGTCPCCLHNPGSVSAQHLCLCEACREVLGAVCPFCTLAEARPSFESGRAMAYSLIVQYSIAGS
ncbi:hypothetical protein ACP70R_019402 [Stipagrostis hirtigluma subsp. patula]